jgi:hypothetical protein
MAAVLMTEWGELAIEARRPHAVRQRGHRHLDAVRQDARRSVSLAAFAGAGGLATPCRFSAQSQSGTPEAEGWAYQFIRLA